MMTTMPRRALFLTLPFLAATLAAPAGAQSPARSAGPTTLKDAYKDHFLVGVAINRSVATGDPAGFGGRTVELIRKDIALTKEQFNQISPENDLKWESLHPRPGADGYNFAPADAFVDFGIKNNQYLVGHTLVW
ncbi:MAG: endo-1,4-beta-xylanase, partial [Armatimonadota bacterium]